MGALHLHIETVFENPDLLVLRTTTESCNCPVVMVIRADQLHDAVLTMLDALPPDDERTCVAGNHYGK
jgi:hypothetical protein